MMLGEKADNTMSQNKREKERQEMSQLVKDAIDKGTPVQTIPPVESESEEILSGKAILIRDVATYLPKQNTLRLDLLELKGHKVSDVVSISGVGDILVTASLGRLKAQPKVDDTLKDKHVQSLSAKALEAFANKDYAQAKELTARIDSVQRGQSAVVATSNVNTTVVPLSLGTIEGKRFVFGRSAKGTVLYFGGVAHKLRYTVSRGLLENETERPTERQTERKAKKEIVKQNKSITRDADLAAQRVAWTIEQIETSNK